MVVGCQTFFRLCARPQSSVTRPGHNGEGSAVYCLVFLVRFLALRLPLLPLIDATIAKLNNKLDRDAAFHLRFVLSPTGRENCAAKRRNHKAVAVTPKQ